MEIKGGNEPPNQANINKTCWIGRFMIAISKEKKQMETAPQSDKPLIGFALDDYSLAQLLEIARRHCNLVLEHGKAHTTAARRSEISEEIQSLRSAREALIDEGRKNAN